MSDARVPRPSIPAPLLTAGLTLALEGFAVEITGALAQAGHRSVLLKGPSLNGWLYPHGSTRRSGDVDLLVDPLSFADAEALLARMGYRPRVPWRDDRTARHWAGDASVFEIDLHRSIVGIGLPPAEAWDALCQCTEQLPVRGGLLEVLTPTARCVLLALHAVKHREAAAQPLADLQRGIEVLPASLWDEAAELAARLDAVPAFAAGLRLVPEGIALADRLGLSHRTTPEVALFERRAPGSVTLNRLVGVPGLRGKARFAWRRAFPVPATMRAMDPRSGDGATGLAIAYGRRAGWLVVHAGPALAAVVSARRRSR